MDIENFAASLSREFNGLITAVATDRGSIEITCGSKLVEIDPFGSVNRTDTVEQAAPAS